jgi:hypothetical protein
LGSIKTLIRLVLPGLGGFTRFASNFGNGLGVSAQTAEAASIPTIKDTVIRRNIAACTDYLMLFFSNLARKPSPNQPNMAGNMAISP